MKRKRKQERKRARLLGHRNKQTEEFKSESQQVVEGEERHVETVSQEVKKFEKESKSKEQTTRIGTVEAPKIGTQEAEVKKAPEEEWTSVKAKSNIPKHLREKLLETLKSLGIANESNADEIGLRVLQVCESATTLDKLITLYPFFLKQHVDNPEQAFVKLNQWELGLFGRLSEGVASNIRTSYKDVIENTSSTQIQDAIRKIEMDEERRRKPTEEQTKRSQERIDELYDGTLEEISKLVRIGKASREDIAKLEETTRALGGFVPTATASM